MNPKHFGRSFTPKYQKKFEEPLLKKFIIITVGGKRQ